jgi:RecA-family ATPase
LEEFDQSLEIESEEGEQNEISLAPDQEREKPLIPPGIVVRKTFNFGEIYDSTERIKWVIEGLLPDRGLMYVGARSGTGKTNLVLQIAVNMLHGKDTMTLKIGKDIPQQKILVLSLEMPKPELQFRFHGMYPDISDVDKKLLSEGLETYCQPDPFKLWKNSDVADLFWLIRATGATGVIIDSASVSFADSLKDDTQVNATIDNLYMLRHKLDVWMICISHTRKLPAGIVGNMEDVTVDELFGHSGVAQSASSVLLMHHEKKSKEAQAEKGKYKVVYLMNPKARFAAEFAPFMMLLPTEPPVLFRRRDPIPLQPLDPEKKREAEKVAKGLSFAEALKGIDFTNISGGDDD